MWDKFAELCRVSWAISAQVWRRTRRFAATISIGLCAALLVAVLLIWLQGRPPRQIKLLTGPHGGGSERLGKTLADRLEKPEFWEVHRQKIELVVEESQGYEDNRQRIDRDTVGDQIGFTHDGFGPPGNVKILLPLDESYVHIIVSETLWNEATAEHKKDGPRTFGQIAGFLRNPESKYRYTAFLGPELSGTRQTAEMILKHYGVPISKIDSEANFDWEHMKSSLFSNQLHLAFFTTTPGSRTVEKIAHRGGFYLLGLDDVGGIRTRNPHISEATFSRNSYGIADDPKNAFCSTDLKTITTRRVIVCSTNMPSSDGYYLATQIKEAIREEVPDLQWNRTIPDPSQPAGFTFPLHPGSDPIRKDYKPWYSKIPGPFWPTIIIIVLSIVVSILNGIRSAFAMKRDEEGEPDELDHELCAAVESISQTEIDMDRSEYRKWQTKVRELRRKITRHVQRDGVDANTRELLFKGLGELECELELRNPSSETVHSSEETTTQAPAT